MEKFTDDCHFFAVYDGHGSSGKEVLLLKKMAIITISKASQAANDYIQTYLEKNSKKIKTLVNDKQRESVNNFILIFYIFLKKFLKAAFKTAESKLKSSGIDYSNSGTCAIALFVQKNMCYISNLGDSRF